MVVNAVRNIPWFTYFPDNYRWSFIVSIGLMRVAGGGADPAEIFEVCRNLEKNPGSDAHWFEEWARMGDRLRAMGMAGCAARPQPHGGGPFLPFRHLSSDGRSVSLPEG